MSVCLFLPYVLLNNTIAMKFWWVVVRKVSEGARLGPRPLPPEFDVCPISELCFAYF